MVFFSSVFFFCFVFWDDVIIGIRISPDKWDCLVFLVQ